MNNTLNIVSVDRGNIDNLNKHETIKKILQRIRE